MIAVRFGKWTFPFSVDPSIISHNLCRRTLAAVGNRKIELGDGISVRTPSDICGTLVESTVLRASNISSATAAASQLPSEGEAQCANDWPYGLHQPPLGTPRIWRKRLPYLAFCATAVLFGWLAFRLSMTYLPAIHAMWPASTAVSVNPLNRATCLAGDLPPLEEHVRRTAQRVPVRCSSQKSLLKPAQVGRHKKNCLRGDHHRRRNRVHSGTSATGASEDGDGIIDTWGSSPSGSLG